jgi:putative transposase
VIPPRSPEDNGAVERANGSAKFEFYAFYSEIPSLFHIRKYLQHYVHKYNTYRPHQALQYLTPLQYHNLIAEA